MNIHERAALDSGYVRDPNNQERWYPSGPGLPTLPSFASVHIENNDYPVVIYVDEYARHDYPVPVMRFGFWEEYLDYARRQGCLSKPGLPAFSNSLD